MKPILLVLERFDTKKKKKEKQNIINVFNVLLSPTFHSDYVNWVAIKKILDRKLIIIVEEKLKLK